MENLLLENYSLLIDIIGMICVGGAITGYHTADAGSGNATDTGNLDEIIPELWSKMIMGYFERRLFLKGLFDDYSALVKGKGDKINMPELPASTGLGDKSAGAAVLYEDEDLATELLTINKHKYVAKMFEDIAVIQANEELFAKYAQAMGYQLAKQMEADIITSLEGYGTTQAITADNVLSLTDIETAMNTLSANDVPIDECFMLVNYKIYNDLLTQGVVEGIGSSSQTAAYLSGINFNGATMNGNVPTVFGMPVYKCNGIKVSTGSGDEQAFVAHPSALAIAVQQDIRVQSEYSVDYLSTKVVADCIYGSAVRNTTVRAIEIIS